MGSFNVACVISGISMHSDDVVVIPLVPHKYGQDNMKGAYIVSNDGEQALYMVKTLPIYGELDSYGRVENIVENKNTEILEKYFDRSIDDIAYMATNAWRSDTKQNIKGNMLPEYGSLVHRGIYDAMTKLKNTIGEYNRVVDVFGSSYLSGYIVTLCGFTHVGIDEQRVRYRNKYVNEQYPNLIIWSDGNWSEIELDGKIANLGIYHPKQLHEFLLKTYKHSCVDVSALKKLSSYEVAYDAAFEELDETSKLEGMTKHLSKLLMWRSAAALSYNHGTLDSYFMDIYGEHLHEPEIKQELCKLQMFNANMHSTNKSYGPTNNGHQYGNIYAEKVLHEQCLKIINDEIAKRKKENGNE